jgi:hypothetical protein
VSVIEFIKALFSPDDGFIDLRAIATDKGVTSAFIPASHPDRIHAFITKHSDKNVYFGVAARLTDKNGTLQNCGNVRALWVDIDFKDTPEVEARRALEAFRLPPSIIVRTGGGLHCYWLLDEPRNLQSEPQNFKAALRSLARALKADITAAEPARVLRLPGTRNIKYQPAPEVTIE